MQLVFVLALQLLTRPFALTPGVLYLLLVLNPELSQGFLSNHWVHTCSFLNFSHCMKLILNVLGGTIFPCPFVLWSASAVLPCTLTQSWHNTQFICLAVYLRNVSTSFPSISPSESGQSSHEF